MKCGASAVEREQSMRAKQRSRLRSTIEKKKDKMAYQQAQIAVTKAEDFEQLKSALKQMVDSATIEKFYSKLQSRTVYVREFEKIVGLGLWKPVDSTLAKWGRIWPGSCMKRSRVSDQALMREFYLEQIEKVDAKVRQKYQKIYRYY